MDTKNKAGCTNYASTEYSIENCRREFIDDLKVVGERREGMDKLIKYLQKKSCFFQAPADETETEPCEGGLVRQSLNIMSRMARDISEDHITFGEGPEIGADLLDSITIISLLHGIWRGDYYQCVKEKEVGEDGKEVEVMRCRPKPPEERLGFSRGDDHGDEAVYMLQSYINLTRDEALAIRSQEWDPNSVEGRAVLSKTPLAAYFHAAKVKARYLDGIRGKT